MENKQVSKKEGGGERSLHDKVMHNKSSPAGLEQLHSRPSIHCNPTIERKGITLVGIHPVPQTLP